MGLIKQLKEEAEERIKWYEEYLIPNAIVEGNMDQVAELEGKLFAFRYIRFRINPVEDMNEIDFIVKFRRLCEREKIDFFDVRKGGWITWH
jgi:hypothetical protein